MTPSRFTDEELLALIEGELPQHRAAELRDAVRDGDLELAGRLIDMAEHRDFLREMKIDRSELNPGSATTPAGIVAAAISAAERESLVPRATERDAGGRRKWLAPLAAGLGLAAIIGIGAAIFSEGGDREQQLASPKSVMEMIEDGEVLVLGSEDDAPDDLRRQRREQEELRELARELIGDGIEGPAFEWPELALDNRGEPSGVSDPIEWGPVEIAGGTGLSELLSEQEFTDVVAALGEVGVRTEPRSENPLRFAGVDALGDEREFTLEEAVALAKAGRLAIVLENTGTGPSELLAASGGTGGYLAGASNRYALFTLEDGSDEPEGVDELRGSELVRELRDRTADATGQEPGVLASYSFEASGLNRGVSDVERVTLLELIATVTSPLTSVDGSGGAGSRLRLIELGFGGADEAPTSADPDNPFWWLTPEADWSESATRLVPVVVR